MRFVLRYDELLYPTLNKNLGINIPVEQFKGIPLERLRYIESSTKVVDIKEVAPPLWVESKNGVLRYHAIEIKDISSLPLNVGWEERELITFDKIGNLCVLSELECLQKIKFEYKQIVRNLMLVFLRNGTSVENELEGNKVFVKFETPSEELIHLYLVAWPIIKNYLKRDSIKGSFAKEVNFFCKVFIRDSFINDDEDKGLKPTNKNISIFDNMIRWVTKIRESFMKHCLNIDRIDTVKELKSYNFLTGW